MGHSPRIGDNYERIYLEENLELFDYGRTIDYDSYGHGLDRLWCMVAVLNISAVERLIFYDRPTTYNLNGLSQQSLREIVGSFIFNGG